MWCLRDVSHLAVLAIFANLPNTVFLTFMLEIVVRTILPHLCVELIKKVCVNVKWKFMPENNTEAFNIK